jgi:hypothetical protein
MHHVSELLPAVLKPEAKPLSPIRQRFLTRPEDDAPILYQHSTLCQTSLPYRDPGVELRSWERENGAVAVCIQAGKAYDHRRHRYVDVALPSGPKARLMLCYLNTQAVRQQSRDLELEDSFTGFVSHTLGLDPTGRNVRAAQDQLTRLAAARFLFGAERDGYSITLKTDVVEEFELWAPGPADQKMLWTSRLRFSQPYFENLMEHAVPLNETAIGTLSHTALGLDIYCWLAQRLHRISPARPQLVRWTSLHRQFGQGYHQLRGFKRVFLRTLNQVQMAYPDAKLSVDEEGLTLQHSRPPVLKQLLQLKLEVAKLPSPAGPAEDLR